MQMIEELDVRGLEAPAHILTILKKVTELPPGTGLRARLDNNPFQLYDLLQQRGFILETQRAEDGTYIAEVRPNNSAAAH